MRCVKYIIIAAFTIVSTLVVLLFICLSYFLYGVLHDEHPFKKATQHLDRATHHLESKQYDDAIIEICKAADIEAMAGLGYEEAASPHFLNSTVRDMLRDNPEEILTLLKSRRLKWHIKSSILFEMRNALKTVKYTGQYSIKYNNNNDFLKMVELRNNREENIWKLKEAIEKIAPKVIGVSDYCLLDSSEDKSNLTIAAIDVTKTLLEEAEMLRNDGDYFSAFMALQDALEIEKRYSCQKLENRAALNIFKEYEDFLVRSNPEGLMNVLKAMKIRWKVKDSIISHLNYIVKSEYTILTKKEKEILNKEGKVKWVEDEL